jgi:4-hydroxybenzoate polyprenyltransferase
VLRLDRIRPVIKLTRLTGAFGAVAGVWFVVLWTYSVEDAALTRTDLVADLVGATVLGLGLYAFAAGLNDLVDLRRDRAMGRQRPIARGEISPETGQLIITFTLLAALAGAATLGLMNVVVAIAVAAAIVVFNALVKTIPAARLVLLAAIYAAHMLIPNVELKFLWPVWLAMTHALAAAGVVGWISRKSPRLSPRAAVSAAVGWLIATGLLARLSIERNAQLWPEGVSARSLIWIGVAVIVFVGYVLLRARGDRARAAGRVERYASLWHAVYATCWLMGQREETAGWIMAGFAAAGFVVTGIVRELYSIADQPITYRP